MPESAQNKTIIIAEDDLAMREILTRKFEGHGFKVKDAVNGKAALELIEKEKPSLLILDLMMPELDGFGVLEAVRKNSDQQISNMPVVVLSNLWSKDDILKAKSLKADDYLIKAYFTPEEIYAKIHQVLEKGPA